MNITLRRGFALLLTAILLVSALPLTAAAASYYAVIDGQEISKDSCTVYGNEPRLYLSDIPVEPHKDYYAFFAFYERNGKDYELIDDESLYFLQDGESAYLGLFDSNTDFREREDVSYTSALICVTYSTEEFTISVSPDSYHTLTLDDFDPNGTYELDSYEVKSGIIVINELPKEGVLYLSNEEVREDDRIRFSDINSGKFVYSAPETGSATEDSFVFSARINEMNIPKVSRATMYIDLSTTNDAGLATSADATVELDSDGVYTFEMDDFDYSGRTYDVEDFEYIRITTLPQYGYVQYEGVDIRPSTQISLDDIEDGELVYTLDTGTDYSAATEDSLVYVVYTDKQNSVYTGTLNVDLSRFSAAGYDYTVRTDTRGSRTFRLSDFDDPDGEYEAEDYTDTSSRNDGYITLRTVPSYGKLELDGDTLSAGEDVYLDDIRQGYLKYVPDSATDSRPDTFEFMLYDADGDRLARDDMYIDRTAVKTGIVDYYGEDALVAWMTGKDEYVFTLEDLDSPDASYPLETYHDADDKEKDGYIQILTTPDSGELTLYSGRKAITLSAGDEVFLDEIVSGEFSYIRDDDTAEAHTSFTFCAFDDRGREVSPSSVTVYIDFYESAPIAKGSYTYSVGKTAKTVRVEFTDLSVDSTTLSVTTGLSAGDLTDLAAAAGFTGGTLELVADVKDTSLNSRTITLDASLFTDRTKSSVFKTIRLVTTDAGRSTSGAAISNICKLSIPTASVESLYVMSTADFTLTMEKYTMQPADKTNMPNNTYNGGLARKATFYVGNTKVNVDGAAMTLPYGKITVKPATVVMMTQQTDGSFAPALSSSYNKTDYTVTGYCDSGYVCTPYYRGSDSGMTYNDMGDPSVAWALEYVYSLAARNVVQGVGNGSYAPRNSVTRAEFIKMLIGSLGLYDATATCSFTDIRGTSSEWAYAYIASAVKAGIVEDGTSFNPGKAIDRQTMALYAYRASLSGAADIDLPTTHAAKTFVDQSKIGSANLTAVTAMQRAGIIQGDDQDRFDPTGTTTRAAAAKIICMLMQYKYQ